MLKDANGYTLRKPSKFAMVNGRMVPQRTPSKRWRDASRKASIKEGSISSVGMI